MYDLPTSLMVCGSEYEIRSDYRAVLDVCTALSDVELTEQERALVLLGIFYPEVQDMPPEHYEEAIKQCFWFINCGDEQQNRRAPKLMDWEQDFKYIVAPVNRVIGSEIRSIPYLHWWSFVSAYYEIGDCLFAQIVRIRDKKARGKSLDKEERKFYQDNQHLIDLKMSYTAQEEAILDAWIGNEKQGR